MFDYVIEQYFRRQKRWGVERVNDDLTNCMI